MPTSKQKKNTTPNYHYPPSSFIHYTYEVGHYKPDFLENPKDFIPYQEDKSKLVWNVFYEDFNDKEHPIKVINLFEFNFSKKIK